jgi:2-methylisocitrate lyase-like PEP mutase family enzyme
MTKQQDRARTFHALHRPGDPITLFNIWDPGSAQAVEKAGASALATGSASVAGARGYVDRETLPMGEAIANASQIVACVDIPLTIDFEGAYAVDPAEGAANVVRIIEAGAIGINFEDQIIDGEGLHPIARQCARISAIRAAAEAAGIDFFINARTDVWLKAGLAVLAENERFDEALLRAKSYADAGASGFFAPGLADEGEIEALCKASPLPVNAMMFDAMPSHARLGELGVARISHAAGPWRLAMAMLESAASELYKS